MNDDLARAVDAAQSILHTPAAAQARLLERAMAACSAATARAMAKLNPSSGASVLEVAGGIATFAGEGSPLTQGLAMGLDGRVTAAELDAMERHVCPSGRGARQLEICPTSIRPSRHSSPRVATVSTSGSWPGSATSPRGPRPPPFPQSAPRRAASAPGGGGRLLPVRARRLPRVGGRPRGRDGPHAPRGLRRGLQPTSPSSVTNQSAAPPSSCRATSPSSTAAASAPPSAATAPRAPSSAPASHEPASRLHHRLQRNPPRHLIPPQHGALRLPRRLPKAPHAQRLLTPFPPKTGSRSRPIDPRAGGEGCDAGRRVGKAVLEHAQHARGAARGPIHPPARIASLPAGRSSYSVCCSGDPANRYPIPRTVCT